MKQIIILNGPPRSGKDLLASHLVELHKPYVIHIKFANELKKITHRFYNTPDQHPAAYESLKDQKLTEFLGLTPRQAYINISEGYIKRFHGKDFFGLQLIGEIKRHPYHDNNVFVVSDGGFGEEVEPLLNNFNPRQITIVQIHRPGCSFDGDSRQYIDRESFESRGVKFLTINNDYNDPEAYCAIAAAKLEELIGQNLFGEPAFNNALYC
jgi:hypothetical protein